jgi:hypothetical protein
MLDLKAKLAAAGLVTQDQIAASERKDRPKKPAQPKTPPAPKSGLDVAALKKAGKSELYDATRRIVDRARLDVAGALPSERAEAFHFTNQTGGLARLTLEPEITAQLVDGRAGIVAYMSHHGLAHCVVPRIVAEDLAAVVPTWLRVLKDHPAAGQIAPPAPPKPGKKSEDDV